DTHRLGHVVSFLANGLYLLGDHAGALAAADRARDIAVRLDDFQTRTTADIYAGRALYALGRYQAANQLFRAALDTLQGERADDGVPQHSGEDPRPAGRGIRADGQGAGGHRARDERTRARPWSW